MTYIHMGIDIDDLRDVLMFCWNVLNFIVLVLKFQHQPSNSWFLLFFYGYNIYDVCKYSILILF